MSKIGRDGGVPQSAPATEPDRNGPLAWWRGHHSPLPAYGRLEADPGYVYTVINAAPWIEPISPPPASLTGLCHTCVVTARYCFQVARITWREVTDGTEQCTNCGHSIEPKGASSCAVD